MYADYLPVGYTYRAAEYCPEHVVKAVLDHDGLEGHGLSYIPEEALDLLARLGGINRQDEYTFDSDDFPKVIFGYQVEDADSCCETCGKPLAGRRVMTVTDQERQDAYDAHCLAQEQDYAEEQAAGGRTICPQCGKRSVTHRSVVTLGYAGHPGAEYSDLAKCESCDYREV